MTEWTFPEGTRLAESVDKLVGIADGPIGWIVYNNPERRNALSRDMWEAIPALLAAFEALEETKLLILTGAGGKAFISGADISEFENLREGAAPEDDARRVRGQSGADIADCRLPTIAMISGACVGGGLATALNCDIRIAAEGSRFGIPAAKLGIGYPPEGVSKLVSLIGPAHTKAVLFTAELYSADAALSMGLVNEVVPADDLLSRVKDIASKIAANAPLTLSAAKITVDELCLDEATRDMTAVNNAVERAMNSADVIEGHRAFLEKRPSKFTGR